MKKIIFAFFILHFSVSAQQAGDLDLSFSIDGKQTTAIGISHRDGGNSVAIQLDGKIVVAGSSDNGANYDFAVVRYNSDGSLDSSFSEDGKQTTAIGSRSDMGTSVAIPHRANL